MWMIKLYKAVL